MPEGRTSERPRRISKDQARHHSYYANRIRDRAALIAAGLLAVVVGAGAIDALGKKEPIPNADQVYDGVVKITQEIDGVELRLRTSPHIPHGGSAEPNIVNWPFPENAFYISNPKIVLGDDPRAENYSQSPWIEIDLPQGEIYANFTGATDPMVRVFEKGTFINGHETADGGFIVDGGDKLQPNVLSVVSFEPPPTPPTR